MPGSAITYRSHMRADPSAIVGEMIRTGLVWHKIVRLPAGDVHLLVPAIVHGRSADTGRSACFLATEGIGPKRVRLADELDLVDCLACLEAIGADTSHTL